MELQIKKRVFYSFHFDNDFWRTQQVRNIGVIEGNTPVSKNEWEEVKKRGNTYIERWIEDNLKYKSCTVVLVGSHTATRPWVLYEIEKSWNDGKGVVGICIHNLEDHYGLRTSCGPNPFDLFNLVDKGKKISQIGKSYIPFNPFNYSTTTSFTKRLSDVVKLYDPPTYSIEQLFNELLTPSQVAYRYISSNIEKWVEEAINIRNQYIETKFFPFSI